MRDQNPQETLRQIGRMTLMAVGARNFMFDKTTQKLTFKITISPSVNNHITVVVNGGDLYDLELLQTRMGRTKVTKRATDVFCDDINEVVYRLGTKHEKEEWYNAVGIHTVKETVAA